MALMQSQIAPNNWNWDDFKPKDGYTPGGDIEEIATLQKGGGGGLPSWLNPNPNALTQELKRTYKGIPGMFDTAGIEAAYNDEIATVSGMGGQIATNAAREAIARGSQTGGQVNSEMAKAQAMLPVFQQTGGLAKDKADAMLDAAKAQASLQAQVASTLGSLRTNYLANLAQVHMQKKTMMNSNRTNAAELALRKYQGDQSHDLQVEELAQRGELADRQQSLNETQLGLSELEKADFGAYYTEGFAQGSPGTGRFTGGDRGAYNLRNARSGIIGGLLGV